MRTHLGLKCYLKNHAHRIRGGRGLGTHIGGEEEDTYIGGEEEDTYIRVLRSIADAVAEVWGHIYTSVYE